MRSRLLIAGVVAVLLGGGGVAVQRVALSGPGLALVPASAPRPLSVIERWSTGARVEADDLHRAYKQRREEERLAKIRAIEEARRARVRELSELLDPAHVPTLYRTGRVIEVSVALQHLVAWEDGAIFMHTDVSTGMPGFDTPTGEFHVGAKAVNGWSRKWEVVMPWMLQFSGNYTIHQVTHRQGSSELIGRHSLGRRASHGCIRVDVGEAENLYHWASKGDVVWIH